MTKAFVDTTVLTDALLKDGDRRDRALAALSRYESTEMPVYAIKEFKLGPLSAWVWLHNKLKLCRSLSQAAAAIQALHPLRAHLRSTALEALALSMREPRGLTLDEWIKQYGKYADPISITADRARYSVRRWIRNAWRRRRELVNSVVGPLNCFGEVPPTEDKDGLIVMAPLGCEPKGDCCLAREMKKSPQALMKLRDALAKLPKKPENIGRLGIIKDMIRVPKRQISDQDCRKLGDAVFAFFAPEDAVVLTTNDSDHVPLAAALGKMVDKP